MNFKLGKYDVDINDLYISDIKITRITNNSIATFKEFFENKVNDCKTFGEALELGELCLVYTAKNIIKAYGDRVNDYYSDEDLKSTAYQFVHEKAYQTLKDIPDSWVTDITMIKVYYGYATDALKETFKEFYPPFYTADKEKTRKVVNFISQLDILRDQWNTYTDIEKKNIKTNIGNPHEWDMDRRNKALIQALKDDLLCKEWFFTYLYGKNFEHEADVFELAEYLQGEAFGQELFERFHIIDFLDEKFVIEEADGVIKYHNYEKSEPAIIKYCILNEGEDPGDFSNTTNTIAIHEFCRFALSVKNLDDFENDDTFSVREQKDNLLDYTKKFRLGDYLDDSLSVIETFQRKSKFKGLSDYLKYKAKVFKKLRSIVSVLIDKENKKIELARIAQEEQAAVNEIFAGLSLADDIDILNDALEKAEQLTLTSEDAQVDCGCKASLIKEYLPKGLLDDLEEYTDTNIHFDFSKIYLAKNWYDVIYKDIPQQVGLDEESLALQLEKNILESFNFEEFDDNDSLQEALKERIESLTLYIDKDRCSSALVDKYADYKLELIEKQKREEEQRKAEEQRRAEEQRKAEEQRRAEELAKQAREFALYGSYMDKFSQVKQAQCMPNFGKAYVGKNIVNAFATNSCNSYLKNCQVRPEDIWFHYVADGKGWKGFAVTNYYVLNDLGQGFLVSDLSSMQITPEGYLYVTTKAGQGYYIKDGISLDQKYLSVINSLFSAMLNDGNYSVPLVVQKSLSEPIKQYQNEGTITCPMKGKILKVCCRPGEHMKAGNVILVLEAMKMENEIMCPCDGMIREVRVSQGQNVNAGDIMVTMVY